MFGGDSDDDHQDCDCYDYEDNWMYPYDSRTLNTENDSCEVTPACEGKQTRVHERVIAANSPVLEEESKGYNNIIDSESVVDSEDDHKDCDCQVCEDNWVYPYESKDGPEDEIEEGSKGYNDISDKESVEDSENDYNEWMYSYESKEDPEDEV